MLDERRPRPTTSSASGGCSATSGSTSSAAPTARRSRSSTRAAIRGSVRTRHARRRLALEHAGVRARSAQRRARAARRIARCRAPQRRACARFPRHARPSWSTCWPRTRGSADGLATAVAVLLRTPEDAARMPLIVHQAAAGTRRAARTRVRRARGRASSTRARAWPMVWTILCSESWARFDVAATARASGESYLAHAAVARAKLFRQACAAVPARPRARRRSALRPSQRAGAAARRRRAIRRIPPANLRGWRAAFPNGRLVTRARPGPRGDRLRLPAAAWSRASSARAARAGSTPAVRGASRCRASSSASERGCAGADDGACARVRRDAERAGRAQHRHGRGDEERGAGAVDEASGAA